MLIKRNRMDFLNVVGSKLPKKLFKSKYYRFIHPNLDYTYKHLVRSSFQHGSSRLIKYLIKNSSEKGKYTYEFFNLKEFEIDNFNEAQGKKGKRKIKDQEAYLAYTAVQQQYNQ